MIIVNCEQGSREWTECRLGIPTASAFSRIVTPGGKLSAAREEYQGELLAEWALGEADEFGGTDWMERGKMLEPEALQHYAFYRDLQPDTRRLCLPRRRQDGRLFARWLGQKWCT